MRDRAFFTWTNAPLAIRTSPSTMSSRRSSPRLRRVPTRLPRPMALLTVSLALGCLLPLRAENEVGYIEKFALAADRAKVLGELVPGSEDYYFFHALHYQNTRNTARLADIMAEWRNRFRDNTPLRQTIENRESLLTYDASPQETLNYLKRLFGVEFNHTRQTRDQKPDLPTQLAPGLVTRQAFEQHNLADSPTLEGLSPEALASLVRQRAPLLPSQRKALLGRLQRPDVPGLVELVHEELRQPNASAFGSFPIHAALTLEQLDALLKLMPDLGRTPKFVHLRLRKLAPSQEVNLDDDPAEREAWLDRLWTYAQTLPPTFNTLKSRVLHLRLQHDRSRGVYDQARFLEYLKLPRQQVYVSPRLLEETAPAHLSNLSADLAMPLLDTPAPGNDEELVRDYFLNLFTRAGLPAGNVEAALAPWTPYVRSTWLRPVFAEAMIVAGLGSPESWASLLSPGAYQALKERVDIHFPATNAARFRPGEDVTVEVDLKNTPDLIIRTYEINQLNYFLTHGRQLNTDLNLDGLVANEEDTRRYEHSPFSRHRERFTFASLKGRRGAWVIEFIGGGRSSRVLVRVGQWQVLQRPGSAGDVLLVVNEDGNPVPDAVAWLDGRRHPAQPEGRGILVPFTSKPGMKSVVVADATGTFASLARFEHHAEEPVLDVQFHVAREQLLARREALLVARPSLFLNGAQLPLNSLLEPRLLVTTRTLDGIATTQEVKNPPLSADAVLTHRLVVPDRLAELSATFTAQLPILSRGGEKQTLRQTRTWTVNTLDRTDTVLVGRFSTAEGRHFYELLGKNGEPAADRPVNFTFHHRDFPRPLHAALRTDDRGRIGLGTLPDVSRAEATGPGNLTASWTAGAALRTWPSSIHGTAGTPLRLPAPEGLDGGQGGVSLLELRAGTYTADHQARVTVRDGFVVLEGLAPGDYSLQLHGGERVEMDVKISAGKEMAGWLLGRHRHLELRGTNMLHVAAVTADAEFLTIRLANPGPFARVHVTTSRFDDPHQLFNDLAGFPRMGASAMVPPHLPNLYAAGRQIGDEYRYILDRRRSPQFPGSMLTRPGLLLNPWEIRETGLSELQVQAGQAAGATAGGTEGALRKAAIERPRGLKREAGAEPGDGNLDFLALTAPTLYNLRPDKDGLVKIPRAALGDRQEVQIHAEDLAHASWRSFSLPETGTRHADVRLAKNLEPGRAFTETREVAVLQKGQPLLLEDATTSEMETYDTLGSVFTLYTTLNPTPQLAQFAWVLRWPSLTNEEKLARYGEFACHELNFFLHRKDPAFFDRVIKPYLANKKDRTFMDDYLLEADLRPYLEPWRHARLNAAERALLGSRLPGEAARAARALQEEWELLPPSPDRVERLFETALRGRALEPGTRREGSLRQDKVTVVGDIPASGALFGGQAGRGSVAIPAPAAPAAPKEKKAQTLNFVTAGVPVAAEMVLAEEMERVDARQADRQKALKDGFSDQDGQTDAFYVGRNMAALETAAARPYFRELGPVKEWAENNYHHLRQAVQDASLIPVNAFWRDFARWTADEVKKPFLSPHLAEASRNFPEMILALAVLDLPFEAPAHAARTEELRHEFTPGGPVVVFHKQIRPAAAAGEAAPGQILVSQSFFRADDRFREEGGEKVQKSVSTEFLTGVVYGANVVVTNASSSRSKAEVLLQIPRGSVPVRASRPTRSVRLTLEPYTTVTQEYYFYFPTPPGEGGATFAHYPVQVAVGGQAAGSAPAFQFPVVNRLTTVDKTSWEYISQEASEEEVFTFLEQSNLGSVDLTHIAWRCRESVDFYRRLMPLLAARRVWNPVLASYALHHNDAGTLGEWLKFHAEDRFGPWLDSPVVKLDALALGRQEHLEYSPLVNQRAHRLGAEWRIANPDVLGQYQQLLHLLAHKRTLTDADQLAVVYFLFLQDRVEEALARFKTVDPTRLATRLQHDYLRCQAAFYEGDLATARTVAAAHREHPVPRWRDLFGGVLAQLDEIEGRAPAAPSPEDGPDRERQQANLAATEPGFEFKVENQFIHLTWRNLREVKVNYYRMDPEFSFSSSPFVSEDASRFSVIMPNLSDTVALPAGQDSLAVALPKAYDRANLLIEVVGAGQRKTQAYHANTIKLAVTENYGLLEARDATNGQALPKAYVKVYARLQDGSVRFFKDGYTDLRGRFDYASRNRPGGPQPPTPLGHRSGTGSGSSGMDHPLLKPGELNVVSKLSVLVLTGANGALVREITPPAQ